jgi:hypothetical protein
VWTIKSHSICRNGEHRHGCRDYERADPELKRKIGLAAYFIAAGKALGRLPVKVTIQLDDHQPIKVTPWCV